MDILTETKLFPVVLYFVSLIASLLYVLWMAFRVTMASPCRWLPKRLAVFIVLGAVSMAVSWREIYLFVLQESKNYPDIKTYVKDAEIIVEAYRVVTDTLPGYWWSSQLLMFVLPYVVFLNTKARQIDMSTLELCAYTWLGYGGSISTSLALFLYRYLLTVSIESKKKPLSKMSVWGIAILTVCLWLSYITILCLYSSVDLAFKVYLLLLHLFLFIPSMLPTLHIEISSYTYSSKDLKGLIPLIYALLAVFIAGHHFYFTHLNLPLNSHPDDLLKLINGGFDHHSQSGISTDLVFSFIICSFYLLLRPSSVFSSTPILIPFLFLTPCLSLGCTFSLLMLYEEHVLEDKVKDKLD